MELELKYIKLTEISTYWSSPQPIHGLQFSALIISVWHSFHTPHHDKTQSKARKTSFLSQKTFTQVHLHLNYIPDIANPLEVPGFTCSNWLAAKHILILIWTPPSFHIQLPRQHSWEPRIHPTDLFSCNTPIATWPQILETPLHLGLTVTSVCSFLLKEWLNVARKHCNYWELEQSRTGEM